MYAQIKDYRREADRLDELIRSHSTSGGNALLDVACGTGRHLELLRDRYEVEGIDLDPAMLEIARRRLPGVPLLQGDMTKFDLGRQFDAVTCLFSAIGHLQTEERLRQAIDRMAAHAKPGGVVIVEPWLEPQDVIPDHMSSDIIDEERFQLARFGRVHVEGTRSTIQFDFMVATPEGVEYWREEHPLGLFTREQTVAAFEAAGLQVHHDPEGLMGRGLYIGVKRAAV